MKHKFRVLIAYEVEAQDEHEALFRVWDAVNYGKEETAHTPASPSITKVETIGLPTRIKS